MVCCWAIPGAPKQSWSATVAFTHAKLLVLRWADEVSSTGLYQKVHNGLFIERRKRGMCRHAQGVRCVATLVPAHPELRRPRTALFGIAWGGPVTGATHTYHSRAHEFSFYIPCATRSYAAQAPFQLLLRVILVACCDWDGILARHAGRVGPGQFSCSSHCDATHAFVEYWCRWTRQPWEALEPEY